MTTYNGEKFLKEQLDSIIKQSRQIDELVVCDDGSTDSTIKILNEFLNIAPFSMNIVINEKNLGSTKNFEKAMSLCKNDIIILCDQDDVWLYDKVKVLENIFLMNQNCGMIFTNAVVIDEMNNTLNKLWFNYGFDKKKQNILKKGKGIELFIGNNIVTGATAAVRKSFFERTRPFPPELVHDHWLASIAVLERKLFFNDTITTNYRKHSMQQLGIGIPAINFSKRINKINNYNKIINSIQIMLNEFNYRFHLTQEQRKMFTDKIEFYMFRKNLSSNYLICISGIIRNLFCGNYHKFASGLLSVAKDMKKILGGGCDKN
jgi:glycosyltransferase involved in cell wall biosynthesis